MRTGIEMPVVKALALSAILAFALATPVQAAPGKTDTVDSIIAKLDLTSFPNSVGPRRTEGKKSFADYGFVPTDTDAKGAVLTAEFRWDMSFTILSSTDKEVHICFWDRALNGGTYNSTSALSLTKRSDDMWIAREVKGGFEGCANVPEDA